MADFKKFIMRGNVLDLAVAVIIGGTFGKIISSMVNDILMPILGLFFGKINVTQLKFVIEKAIGEKPEVAIYYGNFLQNIMDFLFVALAIFMLIRIVEKLKAKPKPEDTLKPIEVPADIQLLQEIRDLLKKQ